VLAIRQHHTADCDLVHLADGLADHGEGVVADLTVGPEIVGADQVARIDVGLSTNSSISMVRVDPSAICSVVYPGPLPHRSSLRKSSR
jgi:hypothetical protein